MIVGETRSTDSAVISASIVARRCNGDYRLLSELTTVDWVVLDFVDGKRSFQDLAQLLPTEQAALTMSFRHLKGLGFLTWEHVSEREDLANCTDLGSKGFAPATSECVSSGSVRAINAHMELDVALADLSDFQCLQYLPKTLLSKFRAFRPKHFDPSLDMDIGTQALIEFLDQHIESLSPYEILGLEPTKDKVAIRQAYLKRSRLFHPDRYFRKNIGSYASVLSSLFKAVTRAFSTLQSFDG